MQSGLTPANCRLLDPVEGLLHGVRSDGRAVLLLGFESAALEQSESIERAIAGAVACGGVLDGAAKSETDGDADRWKSAVFQGPYLQNVMVSLAVVADTFETACTWDRFEETLRGHRRRGRGRDARAGVCRGASRAA